MTDRFVYVTYIRTTPKKLWDTLLTPDFARAYFWGRFYESDWKVGSPWQMKMPDGGVDTEGEVLECNPPHRLVLSWTNVFRPELAADGESRATFDIETAGENVKLTITHEIARDGSALIKAVSNGWPMIVASLKSLIETGAPLADPRKAA
jgi:uncharacterized protein YndB with AHSA1/START domain